MTRDEVIEKLAQRVAGWHQGERSGRTSTAALINDLLAALRSRPAPPDDLALRHAWEAGFRLCRSYGDNHHHFDGEQKERRWRDYIKGLAAPAPVAAPAPETPAPDAMPAPFSPPMGVCQWLDDGGDYATECGHGWQFIDGDVTLNDAKFCLFCGGKIQVIGAEAQP